MTARIESQNHPEFRDFVAERYGRDWYTRKAPRPVRCAHLTFIPPKAFAALKAEYTETFGVQP